MDEQAPVFADAGPLIILGRASHLWLLRDLFGCVNVTPVVKDEVLTGEDRPGELAIAQAIGDGYVVPMSITPPAVSTLPPTLHAGERSTIEAGLAMPGALLILDDLDARNCAASHGLPYTGSIGVMRLAKYAGLVPAIAGIIERAVEEGLHIAPSLVRDVLASAGEAVPHGLENMLTRR